MIWEGRGIQNVKLLLIGGPSVDARVDGGLGNSRMKAVCTPICLF